MRTPRAEGAGGRDRILAEAQNLQKLTSAQTPLFGGENPELHASDFAGITPRNTVPTTPHPLAAAATPQVGVRAMRAQQLLASQPTLLPYHLLQDAHHPPYPDPKLVQSLL